MKHKKLREALRRRETSSSSRRVEEGDVAGEDDEGNVVEVVGRAWAGEEGQGRSLAGVGSPNPSALFDISLSRSHNSPLAPRPRPAS